MCASLRSAQLKLYSKNNLKLLEDSEDSKLLRSFLNVERGVSANSEVSTTEVDNVSCVSASEIKVSECEATNPLLTHS